MNSMPKKMHSRSMSGISGPGAAGERQKHPDPGEEPDMSNQYPNPPFEQNRPAQHPQGFVPPQPRLPDPFPPKKKHTLRNVLFGAGAVLVVIIGAAGVGGAGDQQPGAANTPSSAPATVDNGPSPDPIVTPTNKPTQPAPTAKTTQPAPKPTKAAPQLTASQEQAIGTAEDYLGNQSFSRKGLIGQLKYEGFSTKDATFAVDHLKVNWNLQAVAVAKAYLSTQHFSRSGLIDQLEYEGFTHSQAVYGVNKAGL